MKKITIDTNKITNWETFHNIFKTIMGFPEFYGNNMDAWVDCMTSLRSPEDRMTTVTLDKEEILVIELTNVDDFKKSCFDQYQAILESSAFVNYRFSSKNLLPVIALSFFP